MALIIHRGRRCDRFRSCISRSSGVLVWQPRGRVGAGAAVGFCRGLARSLVLCWGGHKIRGSVELDQQKWGGGHRGRCAMLRYVRTCRGVSCGARGG